MKTCLMSYENNKAADQPARIGADQPAHPRSLISAFVVRFLDSVMSLVSVTKISSLMLASVAEQAGLSLTWSETPKDTFCHDEAPLNPKLQASFCSLFLFLLVLGADCDFDTPWTFHLTFFTYSNYSRVGKNISVTFLVDVLSTLILS